ncbi:MAG: T9SS type A sorting domain-containing protein [Chitinophagales bacterium]
MLPIKLIRLFFLLMLITQNSSAQNDLLVNFSGQQIENYIHLSFTVHGGTTCTGTKVERSTDSIHYETVGMIPGICGSSFTDESYTFDDSLPVKNQFSYYRINFNQYGITHSIKVRFVDYGNSFVIAPNPSSGQSTVFFSNPGNQKITFSIFNLQGNLMQSTSTYSDAITVNGRLFPSGIYFLQAENNKTILFTGKIIFQ